MTLGFFGDRIRAVSRESGIPIDDLIFDPNRAFREAAARRREREHGGARGSTAAR